MQIVSILTSIMVFIITILFFLLIKDNVIAHKYRFTLQNIDKQFKKVGYYGKLDKYLSKVGLKDMFKVTINPTIYMIIKILLSLFGFAIVINKGIMLSLITSFLSYFLLDFLAYISNKADNKEMLQDIKNVYDTLRLQTKAGVFITTSLTECYLVVKNPRFKKGLLELNGSILIKNDIETSVDEFANKFNNTYMDTFTIVIKQSIESGKSLQILKDLSVQIRDIEDAINIRRTEKLKFKLGMLQLLIFIGITAIIAFNMLIELNSSIIAF